MWGALEEEIEDKPAYRGDSLIGLVIGMPIIGACLWLWTRVSTGPGCETFINNPLLIFGILLLFFSVCGICTCISSPMAIGCCCREHAVFFLFLGVLGYGVFVLVISTPGDGRLLPPEVGFQDYVLEDYSHWMQKRVNNTPHWEYLLKRCLVKKKVCHKFFDEYVNDTQPQFFARHLSSIESGCCKPPTNCNFSYTSGVVKWRESKHVNQSNMDCNIWNEDPNIMCFNCKSCKAGFANDVKNNWVKVGVLILVVFCLLLYASPCVSCKGGFYTWWFLSFGFGQVGKQVGKQLDGVIAAMEDRKPSRPAKEITDNSVAELEAGEARTRPPATQKITGNSGVELETKETRTLAPTSQEITTDSIEPLA